MAKRKSRKATQSGNSSRNLKSKGAGGTDAVISRRMGRKAIDSFNLKHTLFHVRRCMLAVNAVNIAATNGTEDSDGNIRWKPANTELEFRLVGFGQTVQACHSARLKEMEFRGGKKPEMDRHPWDLTVWHGKRLLLSVECDEHENFEIRELVPGEWPDLVMRAIR